MLRDVVVRFATACGVTDMERELATGDVMKIVVVVRTSTDRVNDRVNEPPKLSSRWPPLAD